MGSPYRGPRRGPARICSSCGQTHHSAVYETCLGCRSRPRHFVRSSPGRGRCVAGIRGCPTSWGRLDHDHCPDCRRPMAPGQPQCSKCDALLILQAPASRPQLRVELRPAQLQSLGEDMARLDRLGYTHDHEADVRESFDELPDE